MAYWQEFVEAMPELAAYGSKRLLRNVAYLATIRPDGGPRVHPLVAHIGLGRLFVYMEPASPKAHDLQRDVRYALHCSVENTDGGEGEFSIHGRASLVRDPALRTALFESARADGSNPRDFYLIFELGIESVTSTVYDGDRLIRNRWKAS